MSNHLSGNFQDSTAATPVAEQILGILTEEDIVESAWVTTTIPVTADAVNNATVFITAHYTVPATATAPAQDVAIVVATGTFSPAANGGIGSLAPFHHGELAIFPDKLDLPADATLTVAVSKAGTGLVLGNFNVTLYFHAKPVTPA